MITTIGLEIHAELRTRSKIYCSCPNLFGQEPNSCVCPVCLGLPGTLPSLNRKAVEMAVQAGLATHCTIRRRSGFDRKNYMYPDLPKAYQITQFFRPIATDGWLEVSGKRIRIREIHLEEDAGKLIHSPGGETLIDYNRCGVPLIEVVTQPDMEDAREAEAFARELLTILRHLDICDGRMEQGSFRMDLNLSVREKPGDPPGERTETKNLNSFRFLRQAAAYESKRQEEILRSGGRVERETRRFDPASGRTYLMRGKEALEDYRYFPDPDMPDVLLTDEDVRRAASMMAELPEERRKRWGALLTDGQKEILLSEPRLSRYYDEVLDAGADPAQTSALMFRELLSLLREADDPASFRERVPPSRFAALAGLLKDGKIRRAAAGPLLSAMASSGKEPGALAAELDLLAGEDADLPAAADAVLEREKDAVEAWLRGKDKMENYLMGQIMRSTGKGADPVKVREILSAKLRSLREERG